MTYVFPSPPPVYIISSLWSWVFFFFSFFPLSIVLFSITRDLIPWKFDTLTLSPWNWKLPWIYNSQVYPRLPNQPPPPTYDSHGILTTQSNRYVILPNYHTWRTTYPMCIRLLGMYGVHQNVFPRFQTCTSGVFPLLVAQPYGVVLLLCDLSDIGLGWIRSILTPFSLSFWYFDISISRSNGPPWSDHHRNLTISLSSSTLGCPLRHHHRIFATWETRSFRHIWFAGF